MSKPFSAWAGGLRPKVLLVGEAWGESEQMTHQPFVGAAGRELWGMLVQAFGDPSGSGLAASRAFTYGAGWVKSRSSWLSETGLAMTNCFNLKPVNNDIQSLCETKKQNPKASPEWQITRGFYLREEYRGELERLRVEIAEAKPNLLVALGNTACWGVLRTQNISAIRGSLTLAPEGGLAPGVKVLPTYHPAAILRQWSWRPILQADLLKASREAESPKLIRPRRVVLVNPTLAELETQTVAWMREPPPSLSVDIETAHGQITCLGFAPDPGFSLVVPFADPHSGKDYWCSLEKEFRAWRAVQRILGLPSRKIFQNGLYDLQYLMKMGFQPRNCIDDTMLLHHSLYPEMQKGLGFLGSIYTNEQSWKLLRRTKAKDAQLKKDE